MDANIKRARITAVVFGTLASIALIALVHAFIQQGVAKQNQQVATELAEKLKKCEAGIK